MGYYRDPAKTAEAIDAKGWLHTGDVGCFLPYRNALKIIDRKKNFFKLQQGEYVAPEKVESVYLKCELVAEIMVHGTSTESFVVGIIVPHQDRLMALAKAQGIPGEFDEVCNDPALRLSIVKQLNELGKAAGLKGFEQVKNVFIDTQPFMMRGIVSTTMKVQRHEARKFYQEEIMKMYAEGMLGARPE